MPVEGKQADEPRSGALAHSDVPTCQLDEPVSDVLQRIEGTGWDICVVVDDARVVLGLLTRDRMERHTGAPAGDAMEEGPLTTRLDTAPDGLRERMDSSAVDQLLVTGNFGTLAGAVRREDLSRFSE